MVSPAMKAGDVVHLTVPATVHPVIPYGVHLESSSYMCGGTFYSRLSSSSVVKCERQPLSRIARAIVRQSCARLLCGPAS